MSQLSIDCPTVVSATLSIPGAASQGPNQTDEDVLCQFCLELNLSEQDFTGFHDGNLANRRARFQKITLPPHPYIEVHGCSFCRFLVSGIAEANAGSTKLAPPSDDLEYTLEWIKDGRRLESTEARINSLSTRRLRISTNDDTLADVYLVLMAKTDSDKRFLGRTVNPSTIDLSRLRRWLATCIDGHQCCQVALQPHTRAKLDHNPSFRFIDVEKGCIVAGSSERFLALSYVWGGQMHFSLGRSNAESLMQPGGLWSVDLSATIRDAMRLTSLLRFKYLWVDALCIIQDDGAGWHAMVSAMDAVYNLATLTICAAGGDAQFGIPGVTEGGRSFTPKIAYYNKSVHLMVSHPAEHYIRRSMWDSRAWTFQERICSRRSLIYVADRVFYSCRHSVMCEDIHMEEEDSPIETQP